MDDQIEQQFQSENHLIRSLIPQARQLLPLPSLISFKPKFISQCRPFTTQNHEQKYQPLGNVSKTSYNFRGQPINLLTMFRNSVYQRYKQIQVFEQDHLNFNFIRYPLESDSIAKIENQRYTANDYSNDIIFDSQFQSGNLAKVQKISNNQYNLLIQNDINTFGYNQWFFFKVKSLTKTTVKFNIVNMYKQKSLYQHGMKLAVYSTIKAKKGYGWQRGGQQIQYYTNNYVLKGRKHQTLSWQYNFINQCDQVYFAYNYPYTYSDLNNYLDGIQKAKLSFVKRGILCSTLAGNRVDYLTITDPKHNPKKKFVLISARVHPGQTVSSFMMKGIIDYLMSPQAYQLRSKFIFRLIPMLNPDGVINGNYRCSLSGRDLNRRWKNPSKQMYPQIYSFKRMILKIAKQNRLEFFCDLHGHSTKKSIFFYGCQHAEDPYASREFPFIMSKLTKNVNYQSCNFRTQKDKSGTARVSLYNATNLPRIYTIQSSFCGPLTQQCQYTPIDYEIQGKSVCKTILIYSNLKQNRQNLNQSIKQPLNSNQQNNQSNKNYLDQLYSSKQLLNVGNQETSGSQGDPSGDQVQQKYILSDLNSVRKGKQKKNLSIQLKRTTQNKQDNLPIIQSKYKNSFDSRQSPQNLSKMKNSTKTNNSQTNIKKNFSIQKMPKITGVQSKKIISINEELIKKQNGISPEGRYSQQLNFTKRVIKKKGKPFELNQLNLKDSSTYRQMGNRIPFTINLVFEDERNAYTQRQKKKISPTKNIEKLAKQSKKTIQFKQQYFTSLIKY